MLLGCNSLFCNMSNIDITGKIFAGDLASFEIQGQAKSMFLNNGIESWFFHADNILSDFWDCKIANESFKLV